MIFTDKEGKARCSKCCAVMTKTTVWDRSPKIQYECPDQYCENREPSPIYDQERDEGPP